GDQLVIPVEETVAGLKHVEVQPFLLVEIAGGTSYAPGMVGLEMRAAIALGDAGSHGAPAVLEAVRGPVAAQNPQDGLVAVAAAEELAVAERAGLVEHAFFLVDVLLGPYGNQGHVEPQRCR